MNEIGSKWGEKNITGWFSAHLSSMESFWVFISKFHEKYIVWHVKIDRLTAIWIKWGQNQEKYYRLIFSSSKLYWADLGSHLKISWKIRSVAHQNRLFDCTMNDIRSKWRKILPADFQTTRAQLSRFGGLFQNFMIYIGCDISKLIVFLDYSWYIEVLCQIWVFFELIVASVLSVTHLVAFIRFLKKKQIKN